MAEPEKGGKKDDGAQTNPEAEKVSAQLSRIGRESLQEEPDPEVAFAEYEKELPIAIELKEDNKFSHCFTVIPEPGLHHWFANMIVSLEGNNFECFFFNVETSYGDVDRTRKKAEKFKSRIEGLENQRKILELYKRKMKILDDLDAVGDAYRKIGAEPAKEK